MMLPMDKCFSCPAAPVCEDDEFPIVASCEDMMEMYRVMRKHFLEGRSVKELPHMRMLEAQ